MPVRHLVAFVFLAAVAAPAPPAMAQAPCGEPVPVPGVRDPGAVSLFMSGYPSPTGGLRASRVSYLNLRADDRASGGYYQFVARLAAGATWPQAREELAALTAWLASRYPAENEKFAVAAFHDYGPIGCLQRP